MRKVRLIKFILHTISRIRVSRIREENTYERKRFWFRGGSHFPHAQAVSFSFVNLDSRANCTRISRILRTASRHPPVDENGGESRRCFVKLTFISCPLVNPTVIASRVALIFARERRTRAYFENFKSSGYRIYVSSLRFSFRITARTWQLYCIFWEYTALALKSADISASLFRVAG